MLEGFAGAAERGRTQRVCGAFCATPCITFGGGIALQWLLNCPFFGTLWGDTLGPDERILQQERPAGA